MQTPRFTGLHLFISLSIPPVTTPITPCRLGRSPVRSSCRQTHQHITMTGDGYRKGYRFSFQITNIWYYFKMAYAWWVYQFWYWTHCATLIWLSKSDKKCKISNFLKNVKRYWISLIVVWIICSRTAGMCKSNGLFSLPALRVLGVFQMV